MGTKTHRARAGRALSEDEGALEQLGAEVEEAAPEAVPAAEPPFDDSGFLEFEVTGAQVSGEFHCADCGYGVVVQSELPQCPMCGGTVWESRGPLARRRVV
jgi:hypothetical protein